MQLLSLAIIHNCCHSAYNQSYKEPKMSIFKRAFGVCVCLNRRYACHVNMCFLGSALNIWFFAHEDNEAYIDLFTRVCRCVWACVNFVFACACNQIQQTTFGRNAVCLQIVGLWERNPLVYKTQFNQQQGDKPVCVLQMAAHTHTHTHSHIRTEWVSLRFYTDQKY